MGQVGDGVERKIEARGVAVLITHDTMADANLPILNFHINNLMTQWGNDEDIRWIVIYKNGEYTCPFDRLDALYVIDYMKRRALHKFIGFTLETWPDNHLMLSYNPPYAAKSDEEQTKIEA